MLDIPSISAIVAAIGVIIGVVFTYLEVRNLVKARQTELLHGIFQTVNSREFLESWERLKESESLGLEDYRKRYGMVEWNMVFNALSEIGFLLSEKLIDANTVYKIHEGTVKIAWKKMKPQIKDIKKTNSHAVWAFEYLYNEMKRREQQPTKTQ
jgi:hypothetical protein